MIDGTAVAAPAASWVERLGLPTVLIGAIVWALYKLGKILVDRVGQGIKDWFEAQTKLVGKLSDSLDKVPVQFQALESRHDALLGRHDQHDERLIALGEIQAQLREQDSKTAALQASVSALRREHERLETQHDAIQTKLGYLNGETS